MRPLNGGTDAIQTITDPSGGSDAQEAHMQQIEIRRRQTLATARRAVTPDLAYLKNVFVNLFFYGEPGHPSGSWVLIDAGLPGASSWILRAAEERFGPGARPASIVLTHGHFDHVGSLRALSERWNIPVFAHRLELPYLTGRSAYPPPDPTVGGGAMSALSRFYPRGPFDFTAWVRPLPDDGSVPNMPGWSWIHTPGHTPGHVALFRESDRTLIAGDAFVTTRQESAMAAITYKPEIHGPPAYFTPDWNAARRSVQRLAELRPRRVVTGHGLPLEGKEMEEGLQRLARDFDRIAVPRRGRYVNQPAVANESGVVSLPPPVPDPLPRLLLGAGFALLAGAVLRQQARRS
jgi:glyoxylase-like metal-dependent hydrolase (beta-lactamase superfamily II)